MLLGQLLWFGHAMIIIIIIINYKLACCHCHCLGIEKKAEPETEPEPRARRLYRPTPSYATHRVGLDLGLGVISNY